MKWEHETYLSFKNLDEMDLFLKNLRETINHLQDIYSEINESYRLSGKILHGHHVGNYHAVAISNLLNVIKDEL